MAVYDEAFERLFIDEKFIADPEQIIFCLLIDWHARPDAGMDKQEIATTEREIKRVEKIEVLFRESVRQLASQPDLFVPVSADAWFEAVRHQRFKATALAPFVQSS